MADARLRRGRRCAPGRPRPRHEGEVDIPGGGRWRAAGRDLCAGPVGVRRRADHFARSYGSIVGPIRFYEARRSLLPVWGALRASRAGGPRLIPPSLRGRKRAHGLPHRRISRRFPRGARARATFFEVGDPNPMGTAPAARDGVVTGCVAPAGAPSVLPTRGVADVRARRGGRRPMVSGEGREGNLFGGFDACAEVPANLRARHECRCLGVEMSGAARQD